MAYSTMQAAFLILLLGLVTTKPALGSDCVGVSVNLHVCAAILVANNLILIPIPTPACCQTMGQIQALEASIGINRTCVCAQAAVAAIIPAGINPTISFQVQTACAVKLAFNLTGSPNDCNA
ncbi:hypothetical protein PVL29_022714 [Vitis rotundifolia]|uniref:Bifunctional inhibitor/plant lipid transfer protein/seed storage helical domain-containing protein n=1 Tax=Vitis rotundifolia TaxID=103349 RepID=A0AA39DD58_VITRO|nr:hypothetical protein PVL29_022714 [Vitis rotundifolia]